MAPGLREETDAEQAERIALDRARKADGSAPTNEQVGRVILQLESYGDGSEVGCFRESDISACRAVARMLNKAHPTARDAAAFEAHKRMSAAVFRGHEHELPESAQIEIYGRVIAAFKGR